MYGVKTPQGVALCQVSCPAGDGVGGGQALVGFPLTVQGLHNEAMLLLGDHTLSHLAREGGSGLGVSYGGGDYPGRRLDSSLYHFASLLRDVELNQGAGVEVQNQSLTYRPRRSASVLYHRAGDCVLSLYDGGLFQRDSTRLTTGRRHQRLALARQISPSGEVL